MQDTDEFLSIEDVCTFWGGRSHPVDRATVYRQITAGKHPRPVKFGSLSRWPISELIEERNRRMAAREKEAA